MREIWHFGREVIMAGSQGQVAGRLQKKFLLGIGATPSVVMPGLDPGIHHSSKGFFAREMDCRVIWREDALRALARQ
jgi:hypothetical protein